MTSRSSASEDNPNDKNDSPAEDVATSETSLADDDSYDTQKTISALHNQRKIFGHLEHSILNSIQQFECSHRKMTEQMYEPIKQAQAREIHNSFDNIEIAPVHVRMSKVASKSIADLCIDPSVLSSIFQTQQMRREITESLNIEKFAKSALSASGIGATAAFAPSDMMAPVMQHHQQAFAEMASEMNFHGVVG